MEPDGFPLPSLCDPNVALEKGRLMVAQALAHDPEQRKLAEERFAKMMGSHEKGMEVLRAKFPEAYAPEPFLKRIVDRLKWKTY